LGFLGEEFDAAQARSAFFAVALGIAACKAAFTGLTEVEATVVAVFTAFFVFALFACGTFCVCVTDLFGRTALVIATGRSIGHSSAIGVGLAGFARADKLAIIALFAATIGIGLATDASGAFGFSARLDLGGVVVVFGAEADRPAIKLLVGTTAVFDTALVFAKEAAAGLLRIRQATVACEQASGRTQARLGVAVVFIGAIFAGLALTIELTTTACACFLALALAVACAWSGTTATTAFFAFGTFGVVFAASDAGFGFGVADLAAFAIGAA